MLASSSADGRWAATPAGWASLIGRTAAAAGGAATPASGPDPVLDGPGACSVTPPSLDPGPGSVRRCTRNPWINAVTALPGAALQPQDGPALLGPRRRPVRAGPAG